MDALRELWYFLSDWLVDVSAEPGFLSGVLIGALGLALAAFVVFRVRVWWGDVTAPLAPMRVTHTTGETPARVMLSSCTTLLVGLLVLACLISIVIEMRFPGTWQSILDTLGLSR